MRYIPVDSEEELNGVVQKAVAQGYKVDSEVNNKKSGRLTIMIKKKKISAGFCILWFILGIIPMFLYLIYCAVRKPLDEFCIVVKNSNAKAQAALAAANQTGNPTTPTNPQ